MKYLIHIWSRRAVILMLAAFVSGTATGGLVQNGAHCCGHYCQPEAQPQADMAQVKLSSAMTLPMRCCGGGGGHPCDLSTSPRSFNQPVFHSIAGTHGGSPALLAGLLTVKTDVGRIATPTSPLSAELPDPIPIYLEIQSFLI